MVRDDQGVFAVEREGQDVEHLFLDEGGVSLSD